MLATCDRPAPHRHPVPCDWGPPAWGPALQHSLGTRSGHLHLPDHHSGRPVDSWKKCLSKQNKNLLKILNCLKRKGKWGGTSQNRTYIFTVLAVQFYCIYGTFVKSKFCWCLNIEDENAPFYGLCSTHLTILFRLTAENIILFNICTASFFVN